MQADDPWPAPARREINPLWIAVAILGALFLGYKFAERKPDPAPATAVSRPPERSPARAAPPVAPPEAARPIEDVPRPAMAEPREPVPPTRDIYLCKSYGGGMFWSSAICSTRSATVDRIVSVPASMTWDQQVQLGESRWREAQNLYNVPAPAVGVGNGPTGATRSTECSALEAHIVQLDAMARQPQSGATQDWIRSERQAARSRQAALRC